MRMIGNWFAKLFKKFTKTTKPSLLLIAESETKLKQPTRNLRLITPLPAINLNTYQALTAEKLIFTKEAVKNLQKHYGVS